MFKYNCPFCNATGLYVLRDSKGTLCINCMGFGYPEKEPIIILPCRTYNGTGEILDKPPIFTGLKKINNCEKVAILTNDTEAKILSYQDFFNEFSNKTR